MEGDEGNQDAAEGDLFVGDLCFEIGLGIVNDQDEQGEGLDGSGRNNQVVRIIEQLNVDLLEAKLYDKGKQGEMVLKLYDKDEQEELEGEWYANAKKSWSSWQGIDNSEQVKKLEDNISAQCQKEKDKLNQGYEKVVMDKETFAAREEEINKMELVEADGKKKDVYCIKGEKDNNFTIYSKLS